MGNWSLVLESLKVMGFGMAGIFVFMSAFYLIIVGLNKLLPPNKN